MSFAHVPSHLCSEKFQSLHFMRAFPAAVAVTLPLVKFSGVGSMAYIFTKPSDSGTSSILKNSEVFWLTDTFSRIMLCTVLFSGIISMSYSPVSISVSVSSSISLILTSSL